MKHIALLTSILLLGGIASAEPQMLGIADSSGEYAIARQESLFKSPARTMTTIQEGDKIASAKTPVKVQTLSGDVVIVAQNSKVSFAKDSVVQLHEGTVIMTAGPASESAAVTYENLRIAPLDSTESAHNASLVAVNAQDDTVQISANGQPYTVTNTTDGTQVAVVDSEHPILLGRGDEEGTWTKVDAAAPLPMMRQNTRPYVLQQQQAQPVAGTENLGRRNGAAGGSFATGAVAGGIAGLAVGAGTVYLYKDYQDDHDKDDANLNGDDKFDRECKSPFFRR